MKKLSTIQRPFVADKLMDSANLVLSGLVFGQLLAQRVRVLWLVLGSLVYLFGWATAVRLRKGVGRRVE